MIIMIQKEKIQKLIKQGGSHYLRVPPWWATTMKTVIRPKEGQYLLELWVDDAIIVLPNVDALPTKDKLLFLKRVLIQLDEARDEIERKIQQLDAEMIEELLLLEN